MRNRWIHKLSFLAWAGALAAAMLLAQTGAHGETVTQKSVTMSRKSGFYSEPFELELRCEGGEIHYTLDSSEPDAQSPLYTQPIPIGDASANENVFSAIADVSLDLNEDILESKGKTAKYHNRVPSRPIDKATVVRAVCVDALGKTSAVQTGVYFVGFERKAAYDGINILTVTTDPKNLFDFDEGIYVLGSTFARERDSIVAEGELANYLFWPANYRNEGEKWERRASVCFFDRERRLTVEGDFGIRIQGRGSRGRIPKSFNLYARKRYGTQSFSGQELFGIDYPLTRLNLYAGGNDTDTLLTDYLVNRLAVDMKFDTRPYEPYALFLDGEYWGNYWLTPRFKGDYFEGEYGFSVDNLIVVKFTEVEIGNQEDYGLFEEVRDFISANDMSDSQMYERACEMIDIESYIDYCATEIYIGNWDWPINNFSLWRTRETNYPPYGDGRWRWLIYDVNLSMNPDRARNDYLFWTACRDPMFNSLLDNRSFKKKLTKKLVKLAKGCFAPKRVDAFISDYVDMMGKPMENEYLRFYDGEKTIQDFYDSCENIRTFYHKRYDYIMEAYGEK